MRQDLAFRSLGVLALFSGAALVTHIVSGFSLPLALLVAALVVALGVGVRWRRSSPQGRTKMVRFAKVGLGAGLVATVFYDVSKFLLSQWDDSRYNPFEAVRMFGLLLAGSAAPTSVIYVTGVGFHLLNGIFFGVAFCFFFGRRGVLTGVAWGFCLELFQLSLFPGWLNVTFYSEFLQISALSHLVYGAVLGLLCQRSLRESRTALERKPDG